MSEEDTKLVTNGAPLFYADAMVGMAAGAFTSRLLLANQSGIANDASAVMTLVMPTQSLFNLGLHIVATLASKDQIEKMQEFHTAFAESLSDPAAALATSVEKQIRREP